jgi:Ca2+-binding EF-hand superfamily protein
MDASSINSHPSLFTARLAHPGRPQGRARSTSETPPRIQGIPETLPAVAKTVKASATLHAAAPQHIGSNGESQGGQTMLEQLQADWGKADSPWDLTADGTVDIRDVLRLLAKMGGGARDAVEVPEQVGPNVTPVPQDVAEPGDEGAGGKTPIEQLLADWGKTDSAWDLNGDGTVNIRDFLQLLAQAAGGADDAPPITTDLQAKAETITEGIGDADEPADPKTPVEQLLADWGKADSAWDLNGDGTVNIRDFLQLLAQNGGGTDEPADPKTSIEQLLADWGKADSAWDLNGDGTVNIRDFLQLLARTGGGGADDAPPITTHLQEKAETIPESLGDTGEPADPKTPIQQLLADWGKNDSRWDINGDGTVNIRDFLQMLSKMDKASRAEDAPQERGPRVGHMARRARAAYSPTTAQDIALIRRGLSLNAVG